MREVCNSQAVAALSSPSDVCSLDAIKNMCDELFEINNFLEITNNMLTGYFFLAAALLAGVTKGYCGKKTSGFTDNLGSAVFANAVRMLLCIATGFVLVTAGGNLSFILPDKYTLIFSLISGISTSVFVVTWLVSVRSSAYMMVDVFLTFGVIIPIALSAVFFPGNTIKISQLIGFTITVTGILILCSYNNSIKKKLDIKALALLIICALSSGFADFSQTCFARHSEKARELTGQAIPASVFNLYTYVFSAVCLAAVFMLLNRRADKKEQKSIYPTKMFIYILIMAICLFANSYFKTLAAAKLEPIYLYPLNQGGALILSTAMSAVFFKERITIKSVIGTVVAFVGLIIINLL